MRVLVAPDKFKGTLTAVEAADAIVVGLRDAGIDGPIGLLPFADGGDGTVDAVLAAGGSARTTTVTGPLGSPVAARWAILDGTAIIEGAEASGLRYVDPTPETARRADSAGVGELIRAALDEGIRRIVIGIGGSATTDAGAGALRALGIRLRDADGVEVGHGGAALARVATIDHSGLDERIARAEIVLCADVLSPFCGVAGAAAMFGPQKGADEAAVEELDAALRAFAAAVHRATGVDLEADAAGGGAGGMVGGLRAVLGATPVRGVDVLARILDLERRLEDVDVVVVGEGSLDAQSAFGKAPAGIAERAKRRGIRVVAVAGVSSVSADEAYRMSIDHVTSAAHEAGDADTAMSEPRRWLAAAAAVAGEWLRSEEESGR